MLLSWTLTSVIDPKRPVTDIDVVTGAPGLTPLRSPASGITRGVVLVKVKMTAVILFISVVGNYGDRLRPSDRSGRYFR
jgi:hypothetical protein